MNKVFILAFVACTLLSCASKEKKQSANTSLVRKPEKSLSVTSLGEAEFVKSYSEIQDLESEKERDKFMEKREKDNPLFMHESYQEDTTDKILKQHFERLGFVKGDELLLSKFKYSSKPDTTIKSFKDKDISFHFERDTISGSNDKVIIFYGKDSLHTRATFYFKIEYAFLDIIPGGNKELVVLSEHYLMNTEFYYFRVYEIKTPD